MGLQKDSGTPPEPFPCPGQRIPGSLPGNAELGSSSSFFLFSSFFFFSFSFSAPPPPAGAAPADRAGAGPGSPDNGGEQEPPPSQGAKNLPKIPENSSWGLLFIRVFYLYFFPCLFHPLWALLFSPGQKKFPKSLKIRVFKVFFPVFSIPSGFSCSLLLSRNKNNP